VGHWRANFTGLKLQGPWAPDVSPFWRDGLYVYGVVSRGGSVWHVSVLTARNLQSQEAQAAVAIQIIEPVALQTGQVGVNADAMKQGLGVERNAAPRPWLLRWPASTRSTVPEWWPAPSRRMPARPSACSGRIEGYADSPALAMVAPERPNTLVNA
jgi:hypothetical protein